MEEKWGIVFERKFEFFFIFFILFIFFFIYSIVYIRIFFIYLSVCDRNIVCLFLILLIIGRY